MDQLSGLLGGQGGTQLQNLIQQFETGQHQQAPDQQVSSSYNQVASQLPADQYEQAARDAFAKLSPEQRQQFLQELQSETAGAGGATAAQPAVQNATADPSSLAAATTQLHQSLPGSLGQLFAPGGTFSSPIAKAVLLGITAMAAQRLTSQRR